MTAARALPVALLVIASILVILSVAIAVRRVVRDRQLARRQERLQQVRPLLLRHLSDEEPNLAALVAIGGAEGKLLEELAWQMLSKVRGASRTALVEWLNNRGAIERARVRTHGRGAVGRAKAAEMLGAAGLSSTSSDIIRLLDDRRGEVRVVAVRALGKLGDPAAVPHLLGALTGKNAVPSSLVSMALLHIGPGVVDPLIDGLRHRSPAVRAVCADLVGMHGALDAGRPLVALLDNDPIQSVRLRAAGSLGRLGVPQGIEPLRRAVAADSPQPLRVAAAFALGQIGGAAALDALHTVLNDGDEELGATAGEALAGLGEKGISILALVAESEGRGRQRAADWLARTAVDQSSNRRRRASSLPLSEQWR